MDNTLRATDVAGVLRLFEEDQTRSNFNPTPYLIRLCEIIEEETVKYLKMDPDPFDNRHPSRIDPNCSFGTALKTLFKKESFISKLVLDYLRDNYFRRNEIEGCDNVALNAAACRLMIDIMPGLDAEAAFDLSDYDLMVHRVLKWATNSAEPLQTYATGLLGMAMPISEIATTFREQNNKLIPIMLQRLRHLKESSIPFETRAFEERASVSVSTLPVRPFGHLSAAPKPDNQLKRPMTDDTPNVTNKRRKLENGNKPAVSNGIAAGANNNETSNSSWAEMENYVIGTIQMHPLTLATRAIFILRFLTPLGEYQEFLGHIFEHNVLETVLAFINLRETKEARLAFETCRYLAALLCHKKFALEFIKSDGLQRLLEIPRPSIAASGASMCFFYLAYCEDAMENICQMPHSVIRELVSFCLWLLECSHDSGRSHAVIFFALTFQFKNILTEFDEQDGLRRFYNTISTLRLLTVDDYEDRISMNQDEQCSQKQIVRHVCCALRKYFEAHLFLQAEIVERQKNSDSNAADDVDRERAAPPYSKIIKIGSYEDVQMKIETLFEIMPVRTYWLPVETFYKLGGINLMLRVIVVSFDLIFSGRVETLRSALDILSICCFSPRVQVEFCEKINKNNNSSASGINVLLSVAENEMIGDFDVQKSALNALINCICAPINRPTGALNSSTNTTASSSSTEPTTTTSSTTSTTTTTTTASAMSRTSSTTSMATLPSTSTQAKMRSFQSPMKKHKNKPMKTYEDVLNTLWNKVRAENGIMVFINLLYTKLPITDADYIRTLACKALVGLARSNPARQIIGQLPLITNGELQTLMRDPILQENRKEHVAFQKYALQLLEDVSGKPKQKNGDSEISSLLNIHKANIVAQTRIQFNETQLLQLIHQHLMSKGFDETAQVLLKETKITSMLPAQPPLSILPQTPFKPAPRSYFSPSAKPLSATPTRSSLVATPSHSPLLATPSTPVSTANGANPKPEIKIIKRNSLLANQSSSTKSSPIVPIPSSSNLSRSKNLEYNFTKPPNQTISELGGSFLEPAPPRITLDSIIVEYLMNQHALCKNPMATCPEFNLLEPHRCPDPKPRSNLAMNAVVRNVRRSYGIQTRKFDRKLIHSKFCPLSSLKINHEANTTYTKVAFMPNTFQILIGDFGGKIHMYNKLTDSEDLCGNCFESLICNLQPNKSGSLILASQTWGDTLSAIFDTNLQRKMGFDDHEHAEFGNQNQNWVLGTKSEKASLYDIVKEVCTLKLKPVCSNDYTKNKATFDPRDSLVLSDGVLWDINSGKSIHKFDKLNQTQSGVFHPNGLEIVSNTEVWDLRTYNLLKTVPSLNQQQIIFSPVYDIMYTLSAEDDDEDEYNKTTFKTIDSTDYSSISLVDIKKGIYDLAVNKFDTQIVIVENQGANKEESVVRLYDVGRLRSEDDDEQDEDNSNNSTHDQENESDIDFDASYWLDSDGFTEDGDDDDTDDDEDDEDDDEDDEDDEDEEDDDVDDDADDVDLDDVIDEDYYPVFNLYDFDNDDGDGDVDAADRDGAGNGGGEQQQGEEDDDAMYETMDSDTSDSNA